MKQQQQRLNISTRRKMIKKDIVYIELDTKCCCTELTSNKNDASIQFTRRYLQCQSSMPIRILRLLIETILPHSSIVKVSIFDVNDRLLKDSDRLRSLKHTTSSSNYIPIRITLTNTVTSLTHCSCLISPLDIDLSSSFPTIIQQDRLEKIFATCTLPSVQPILPISPCLSSSPPHISTEICNPLTPYEPDEITSTYDEISPSCQTQDNLTQFSFDLPLDLSMKKPLK